MTTAQMQDWDDGTVGFQSQKQVGAGELRDSIIVHQLASQQGAPGGRVVQFATEMHYGGGTTQRSESSIALDPEQAATFARAMSAPRLGGIAGAPIDSVALNLEAQLRAVVRELDEIAAALPGVVYMDQPDGGSPSIAEQVRRMAEDAFKWRESESAGAWDAALERAAALVESGGLDSVSFTAGKIRALKVEP